MISPCLSSPVWPHARTSRAPPGVRPAQLLNGCSTTVTNAELTVDRKTDKRPQPRPKQVLVTVTCRASRLPKIGNRTLTRSLAALTCRSGWTFLALLGRHHVDTTRNTGHLFTSTFWALRCRCIMLGNCLGSFKPLPAFFATVLISRHGAPPRSQPKASMQPSSSRGDQAIRLRH